MSLDYLRGLHDKHENWLFPAQCGNRGLLSMSQLPLDMDRSLHPEIRDRTFLLQGEHVHASIQKVSQILIYGIFIISLESSAAIYFMMLIVCF